LFERELELQNTLKGDERSQAEYAELIRKNLIPKTVRNLPLLDYRSRANYKEELYSKLPRINLDLSKNLDNLATNLHNANLEGRELSNQDFSNSFNSAVNAVFNKDSSKPVEERIPISNIKKLPRDKSEALASRQRKSALVKTLREEFPGSAVSKKISSD
jgi:hypothetical protein